MSTTPNADGSVTIPLTKAIDVAGASVKALNMREPTVADQLAMDKAPGTDGDKEVALIANLCMVAPSDLHALTMRDYKKVQAALVAFTV